MSLRFVLRRKASTVVYVIIAVLCGYFLITRFTSCHEAVHYEKGFAEEPRIFFIESSGEECLTARQVCSVESTARSNPHSQIIVYMSTDKLPVPVQNSSSKAGQQRNCQVTETLKSLLSNVRFISGDLRDHLRGTELWTLVSKGLLEKSRFPVMHWSDAVRIALLWKNGGVYLDLDCIVMRRIDRLRNTAGLVSHLPNWIENGVLAFDQNSPLLKYLMKYMVFAYNPDEYISLGPLAMTQGMKEICSIEELEPMKEYLCLKGARILLQPPSAFYAVSNEDQQMFYEAHFNQSYWNLFQESYLSHVYDAGNGRVVPSDSLYASMARRFCPVTYHLAQETTGF